MSAIEAVLMVTVFVQLGLLSYLAAGDRLVRRRARKRLLVTLKTGETIGGVLVEADRSSLVFRQASMVGGDEAVPVDGELIVARADVAYIQKP